MKLLITLVGTLCSSLVLAHHDGDSESLCAVVYQYENLAGARLEIRDDSRVGDLRAIAINNDQDRCENHNDHDAGLGTWDNQISSLVVEPGCTLVAWQYRNFGIHEQYGYPIGWKMVYENDSLRTDREFYSLYGAKNLISSLKCFCD